MVGIGNCCAFRRQKGFNGCNIEMIDEKLAPWTKLQQFRSSHADNFGVLNSDISSQVK